jgi:hypothetical protein
MLLGCHEYLSQSVGLIRLEMLEFGIPKWILHVILHIRLILVLGENESHFPLKSDYSYDNYFNHFPLPCCYP